MKRFRVQALLTVAVLCATGTAQANWVTLDYPGATHTYATDIDGNRIVGYYRDASGEHGFLYYGTTWSTLDFPGADYTGLHGIDGDNIIGSAGGMIYGFEFVYEGAAWTILTDPCPFPIHPSSLALKSSDLSDS